MDGSGTPRGTSTRRGGPRAWLLSELPASRSARGYPPGRYGSPKFHRRGRGLDAAAIAGFLSAEGEHDG